MTDHTHSFSAMPVWRPMAGRAALALAALIFATAVMATGLHLGEGGGAEPALYALAFGFFFGIPALLCAQQSVFAPGQTRACLFAGRVLGVAWLASMAWLVGLYL
ncbi:hypothetical protein FHY55_09515 [Oceanicola sp. D3]|uniref:hypothetical protein n=1 Tax=Oceanicola sp. D3 TaxID=2587163 RepID=UPI0011210639|nr:hypothetical protein [Oceanicola sp. D3]QDC09470.1 hypothetical protein FHY55_09515 [Oceanicola sp. D3]